MLARYIFFQVQKAVVIEGQFIHGADHFHSLAASANDPFQNERKMVF